MEDKINTYGSDTEKKTRSSRKKSFIIFAAGIVVVLVIGAIIGGRASNTEVTSVQDDGKININEEYIGELSITDVISEYSSSGFMESSSYHHDWLLDRIDDMIADSKNKGLILYMDSPGGSVYASDEMYLKVKEYEETTGRPVFAYFASEAASGAYYISAPATKIVANRNCWTGSIGVTLGTMYDVTGLLDKYGVKTVTITSGDNKAMGSSTEKMTDEQREILQSLVDEAYDQFVGIVAEGRKMDEKEVRKLADGRIYTAKQAFDLGLVDAIGTYDDAVFLMKKSCNLENVGVKNIEYKSSENWIQRTIRESLSQIGRSSAEGELQSIMKLMEPGNSFSVTYLSPIKR